MEIIYYLLMVLVIVKIFIVIYWRIVRGLYYDILEKILILK